MMLTQGQRQLAHSINWIRNETFPIVQFQERVDQPMHYRAPTHTQR